jgi:hypothetical protein
MARRTKTYGAADLRHPLTPTVVGGAITPRRSPLQSATVSATSSVSNVSHGSLDANGNACATFHEWACTADDLFAIGASTAAPTNVSNDLSTSATPGSTHHPAPLLLSMLTHPPPIAEESEYTLLRAKGCLISLGSGVNQTVADSGSQGGSSADAAITGIVVQLNNAVVNYASIKSMF